MTEELRAVWQGSFELFGTTVRAYVLSDGQRVLDAADLELMLGGMQAGAPTPTPEQMEAFAHWQRGESMKFSQMVILPLLFMAAAFALFTFVVMAGAS